MSHQSTYQTIGEYSITPQAVRKLAGKKKSGNATDPSLIARFVNYVRELIASTKAKNELFAMDNRELADIGLNRGDIVNQLTQTHQNRKAA